MNDPGSACVCVCKVRLISKLFPVFKCDSVIFPEQPNKGLLSLFY